MKISSLQNKYATGRFTLPIVYFIFTFVWLLTALFAPTNPPIRSIHSPLWNLLPLDWIPWWLNQATAYILFVLISYSLIQLNNRFTIITQRATIQSSLFLLSIAALPFIQLLGPGLVATLLVTIQTFILFSSYRDPYSMELQFYEGVITALLFLLIPKSIFLAPLLYYTKIVFNNLNLKTFLASCLGFSLPIWFLFGHAFWHDQMQLFYAPFNSLAEWNYLWNVFPTIDLISLASFGFILLFTILSIAYTTFARAKVRVRTRQILNHLLRIAIGVAILVTLEPSLFMEFAPLWILCISFTYGHALISIQTKLTNIIFIIAMVLLAGLFVFNTWIL